VIYLSIFYIYIYTDDDKSIYTDAQIHTHFLDLYCLAVIILLSAFSLIKSILYSLCFFHVPSMDINILHGQGVVAVVVVVARLENTLMNKKASRRRNSTFLTRLNRKVLGKTDFYFAKS